MTVLFDIILPFFALMACGYLAQAKRVLGEHGTQVFIGFTYWFALPALLFRVMAEIDPAVLWNAHFITAYAGSAFMLAVLAFFLGRLLFRHSGAEGILCGMNAAYGNTGHIGIPLMFLAFGEAAAAPTIITTIVSVCISVLSMAGIVMTRQQQMPPLTLLKKCLWILLKNPLFVAPMMGLMVALSGLSLPNTLANFTLQLGNAATPCALFAVGMFLYGKPIKGALPEVMLTSLLKLAVLPLLVWFTLNTIFAVPPLWEAVAVIMAATPVGAGSFVLAKQFAVYEERTSSAILISTAISLISLFLLLQYYLPQIA